MSIQQLRILVRRDNISFETEQALREIIGSRTEGEISGFEEERVRELLELEAELLEKKAQLHDDLADAADDFVGEVSEASDLGFEGRLDDFDAETERKLRDFGKYMDARFDLSE